jgi:hypothetical protein
MGGNVACSRQKRKAYKIFVAGIKGKLPLRGLGVDKEK